MTDIDASLLARLEALRLSVRHVRWGARLGGRFTVSRRGSSIEFADYAAYAAGDDIRAIDWNLYARSDRLFVKTYKEEVELAVEILLDTTTSMALPTAQKFDRACQLALCLASIGLAGRHHIRMSGIQPGAPNSSAWAFHRVDLARLRTWLEAAGPRGQVRLSDWMQTTTALRRMRGGQALVISDCLYPLADWFKALQALQQRHLEVKVIQVITPQELDPARLVRGGLVADSETGQPHELAYSAEELAGAVASHNEQIAWFCKRNGVSFAQHRLDETLERVLFQTLPARGFLE